MNILRRAYDLVQYKIRENATFDALEVLSERQLADLGLAETDLARLARLAAEPASVGLSLERLATLVRESDDVGAGAWSLLRRRLVGAAVEARDAVAEGRDGAHAATRQAEAA